MPALDHLGHGVRHFGGTDRAESYLTPSIRMDLDDIVLRLLVFAGVADASTKEKMELANVFSEIDRAEPCE
jgi:hypothetical protein